MAARDNEKLARRAFDEIWSKGKLELADELIAPDFVGHPPGQDEFHGPEGSKQFIKTMRTGFPDARFDIEDMVAGDRTVALRWTMTGTHEGKFNGIEPTGKEVELTGQTILTIEDGKAVEGYTTFDRLEMMQQLEAVPQLARV